MEQINEKTRIGITPAQFVAIVILVLGVGSAFSVVGSDAAEAKQRSIENKKEIDLKTKVVKSKKNYSRKQKHKQKDTYAD